MCENLRCYQKVKVKLFNKNIWIILKLLNSVLNILIIVGNWSLQRKNKRHNILCHFKYHPKVHHTWAMQMTRNCYSIDRRLYSELIMHSKTKEASPVNLINFKSRVSWMTIFLNRFQFKVFNWSIEGCLKSIDKILKNLGFSKWSSKLLHIHDLYGILAFTL